MATSEDIEQKLICSICLHMLTEPKLLTCGHTYCLRCLQSHICHARSPEIVQGILGFRCPICREFIPAPDRISPTLDWANKYKPNYIVQEILDIHQENKKRRPVCVQHEGKIVELYCRDCMTAVCDRCVSLHHRVCTEIIELTTAVKERQNVSHPAVGRCQQNGHSASIYLQCAAKRRRCENGKLELDRIENDVTQTIDRECQEIIKKVTSHVNREGERLKHEVKGQCHAGRIMVRSYTGKCEELEQVLQRMKAYLQHKTSEFVIPTPSSQQDEDRVRATLDKLGRAVHALENPCHFEVGLSLDDTPLTLNLSNFRLGQINTIKISEKVDDVSSDNDMYSFAVSDKTQPLSGQDKIHHADPLYVQAEDLMEYEQLPLPETSRPYANVGKLQATGQEHSVSSRPRTAPEQPYVAAPPRRPQNPPPQRRRSTPKLAI